MTITFYNWTVLSPIFTGMYECFSIIFLNVFSTVHHSIGLFLQPTLMHNSITTCMSHYYPRHVSSLNMPMLRRNNCTNTASGILALLSGCTLHRLRADCRPLSTGVVYSRLGEPGYQMLCLCGCSSWGLACQGSKHVEDSNVTYMCYWIVH